MRIALVALAACAAPAMLGAQMTAQQKMQNAMSAAPPAISRDATINDWDGTVLRQGSNGWVCMPDMAETQGNDPMCLDAPWLVWVDAFGHGTAPHIERIGFGYMLSDEAHASNVDPHATGPTPDNEWLDEGPHIMMVVPNAAMLAGLPTHPDQAGGGPWVMWRGTPYVHVMIPTPRRGGPMNR